MRTSRKALFTVLIIAAVSGCSSKSSSDGPGSDSHGNGKGTADPVASGDVSPVPVPTDLVGRWRLEVKEGNSSRTSVYNFHEAGRFEVDTRLSTPSIQSTDLVQGVITKVDGDKLTVIRLSHTGKEGKVDPIPPERRRFETYQYRVSEAELNWVKLDEKGQPGPQRSLLKRVKE